MSFLIGSALAHSTFYARPASLAASLHTVQFALRVATRVLGGERGDREIEEIEIGGFDRSDRRRVHFPALPGDVAECAYCSR